MRRFVFLLLTFALVVPASLTTAAAPARAVDASALNAVHWRLIGPFRAGRSLGITGVPGDHRTFYFGAVGGGVWKTEDAGRTWQPIFDSEHVASIGAVAVAPSDPNVVYVGSGEADMRSDIQHGNGMYKSTDAGKTWRHIGLEDTQQIGRILVDPKDANVVYVAALGHPYNANAERGVFKSTDGGATWSKVLYLNANTGAIDLAMDPVDPATIYASLWQTRRPPWNVYPPSNGPGSGLYKSTDSGKTWTHITGHGFPGGVLGHIGIAVSPADRNRIYAVVDTNNDKDGGVYRSNDAGATWTLVDRDGRLWKRGWYFGGITADPKDRDQVYVMNTSTYRSTNGGKSFIPIKGSPGGDDYHAMWIAPDDPNVLALTSDQGTIISLNHGATWSSWYNQPTGQFYHAITDNRFPYWVYGAQQDSGAMAVPSRTIHTGISEHDWRPISVGGESGTIAPDPLHPGLLYGSTVSRELFGTGWEQNIDPTIARPDEVWRSTWTTPIVVSPADPHVIYLSHQKIFRSQDGGLSWRIISPDLTRRGINAPSNLDPATVADSTGLSRRGVVYWIAPSPIRKHLIWAGTDDGLIWLTRDEGAHWSNVTPPQLTPWSKVGVIDASHFDPQTAYAAIDRHRLADYRPYIYRTHDGGKHWTAITNGIPNDGLNYVNVVREDPKRRGLLYAGTAQGVYVSFDDGNAWQPLQRNLPAAGVRDIVFHGNDIVIATHGRAFWIMDDATPLRQMSARIAASRAALLKPATAIMYLRAGGNGGGTFDEGTPIPPDEPQGKNPAWGAYLDYYIGSASTPVAFTITDASGTVMRRFSSAAKPAAIDYAQFDIPAYWIHPAEPPSSEHGDHRLVWDLSYRTDRGPLVPPGRYTVRMTVNGQTYTQPLNVVRDPRLPASNADLRAQFDLALRIEADLARLQTAQQSAKKRHAPAAVLGTPPQSTPDDSVGKPAQDFHSIRFVRDALMGLEYALENAQAAPTPVQRHAFALLHAQVDALVKRW